MKTDIEDAPVEVPRKKRAMERAPDKWIAQWLERDDIPQFVRKGLEEVKADRRRRNPDVTIGLLVSDAGVTPEQRERLAAVLSAANATAIYHPGVASNVHQLCKRNAAVFHYDESGGPFGLKEIVRLSDRVVACPHEPTAQEYNKPGVWSAIGLGVHRSLPVTVILPNGEVIKR